MGSIMMNFAMSASGMFFAFFKGAVYSAILLAFLPILSSLIYLMTFAYSKGFKK